MNFMMPAEIALMRAEFEKILQSPEATNITVSYHTWENPADPDNEDTVYGVNDKDRKATPVSHPIRALMKIVGERDQKLLAYGLLNVGDCMMYISDTVDLQTPDGTNEAVAGSVVFVDPDGVRWEPKIDVLDESEKNAILRVADAQISQVIPCQIERK